MTTIDKSKLAKEPIWTALVILCQWFVLVFVLLLGFFKLIKLFL